MANPRQELKQVEKAIDTIISLLESPEAKESGMVQGILNDAEHDLLRRYRALQKATARKPPKKAVGG